ncbi:MAG: acetyl-CoA carboxylase biotin carboxylase subunit family protein [Pseudonocardiaceae bacterium]
MTIDGTTEVVSILAQRLGPPPRFVELGYDFPAGLDPRLERTLTEYVVAVLAALGFDNGIAHVQLRLVDGVPKIVEVNPRPPGGWLGSLNKVVSGVDLIRALVGATLGRPLERGRPAATHARYRCVVFDRAGLVDYDPTALSAPASDDDPSGPLVSMDVSPGDMVLPLGHPDGGVYGRTVVFGQDPGELDEQCRRIDDQLGVRVTSLPSPTTVAGAGPPRW